MKTIVIVGAGPGLGFSLAKTFGKRGFRVALISRTRHKLESYADRLRELGIEARGFTADITDPIQLEQAFLQIQSVYGSIDVMEFSPHVGDRSATSVLDTTGETALQMFHSVIVGAVHSARQVIPGMVERGEGALLFTSDLSAMGPSPIFGGPGIVMSGLRNYALNLHERLLPLGIFVGHLSISPLIKRGTSFDPDQVAEAWYELYESGTSAEETFPKGIMQFVK